MEKDRVLTVSDLSVHIGRARPVEDVSFSIDAGECFALLGESGCGKSMTALALMRLLPAGARVVSGSVVFNGGDVLKLPESDMRRLRGGGIGMIFQEPATSLNPVLTVGTQIVEALALHQSLRGDAALRAARELLDQVGIPDAAQRLKEYPFQFSGGMKQRVMIAIALAGNPRLLIADEPTTALDVTIQAQVLDLLDRLRRERGMSLLLITHDLGVVAGMADRIGVMYAGQLIEEANRETFFRAPAHPYSQRLFAALPDARQRGGRLISIPGSVPPADARHAGCRFVDRCDVALPECRDRAPLWKSVGTGQHMRCHLPTGADSRPEDRSVSAAHATGAADQSSAESPLLVVNDLAVHFPIRRGILQRTVGYVKAVDGISFSLRAGRTLALVGESGCGKTTAGKAVLHLVPPTAGSVQLMGTQVETIRAETMQMVFQDPFGSLDPRLTVRDIIAEGMQALRMPGADSGYAAQVAEVLEKVGLRADMALRYPHEFSGGQRQRIAIARALAVRPKLLICDEPTSALDVSVQAQILNLLRDLQREFGLAYIFITHNIGVVDFMADEVAVMHRGHIVEYGPAEQVLQRPQHPYTQTLLAAVPVVDGPKSAPQ